MSLFRADRRRLRVRHWKDDQKQVQCMRWQQPSTSWIKAFRVMRELILSLRSGRARWCGSVVRMLSLSFLSGLVFGEWRDANPKATCTNVGLSDIYDNLAECVFTAEHETGRGPSPNNYFASRQKIACVLSCNLWKGERCIGGRKRLIL